MQSLHPSPDFGPITLIIKSYLKVITEAMKSEVINESHIIRIIFKLNDLANLETKYSSEIPAFGEVLTLLLTSTFKIN